MMRHPDETVDAGQSMSRPRRGFTMMEMVAVIAVIAILATLAVPSYLERIVRDQIKESLPLADIAKKPVADAWASTQRFPADNAAAGLPLPDKIVANCVRSVTVRDGAIHITFGNRATAAISGKVLSLRPAVVADAPIVPSRGYVEAPRRRSR